MVSYFILYGWNGRGYSGVFFCQSVRLSANYNLACNCVAFWYMHAWVKTHFDGIKIDDLVTLTQWPRITHFGMTFHKHGFPRLTSGLSKEWTIVIIKYKITFERKRDCIMWKLGCLVHVCISFRRNYSVWEMFHSVWCSPYILLYAIPILWYIAEFTKVKASEVRRSVTGGREVDMPCYMTVMSLSILLYNWCPSRDQCPLAPSCLTAVTRNAKLQP